MTTTKDFAQGYIYERGSGDLFVANSNPGFFLRPAEKSIFDMAYYGHLESIKAQSHNKEVGTYYATT